MTYSRVKDFLQTSGYSKFIENIPKIISTLTKRPLPKFTQEQKDNLNRLFMEVQEPYKKHKGRRKNFLSYSYTTYKFCQLLGYEEFLPMLPLLAQKHLMAADEIWKKICTECKYQFIATT